MVKVPESQEKKMKQLLKTNNDTAKSFQETNSTEQNHISHLSYTEIICFKHPPENFHFATKNTGQRCF